MTGSILTVTTAAAARNLTTVDAVRAALGLGALDDADAALLARLVDSESRAIEGWCNRVFARDAVSEQFRPDHAGDSLLLARAPVVSVASVVEGATTLTAADWEADADSGLLYRLHGADSRMSWAAVKIAVAYTAGYLMPGGTERPTLPADLESACVDLVKLRWFARGRDPLLRSQSIPGVADFGYALPGAGMDMDGTLPAIITARLWRYRDITP